MRGKKKEQNGQIMKKEKIKKIKIKTMLTKLSSPQVITHILPKKKLLRTGRFKICGEKWGKIYTCFYVSSKFTLPSPFPIQIVMK